MKQILSPWIGIVLSLLISGCMLSGIRGNGIQGSQDRSLGQFSRVDVAGSMNVFLTRGDSQHVVIKTDQNLLRYIQTEIEGDRLVIRTQNGVWIDPTMDIQVFLTAPDLKEVTLSGSGDITTENPLLDDDKIRFSLTGSGTVKASVETPGVEVDLVGSGDMDLAGETQDLSVRISGSGNYNGQSLKAENTTVNVLGSGDANVNTSIKLDAKIFGSGNINYTGNPQVDSHVAGSGSIMKK